MIEPRRILEVFRSQRFCVRGRTGRRSPASSLNTENRNQKTSPAFTLFEVLIALGVFAIAVTGLAIALESSVQAALEARQRSLARMQLESRLSIAMADPPRNGRRIIESRDNKGIRVEETLEPCEIRTTNGAVVPGLWTLKIVVGGGERTAKEIETAEIILYKP